MKKFSDKLAEIMQRTKVYESEVSLLKRQGIDPLNLFGDLKKEGFETELAFQSFNRLFNEDIQNEWLEMKNELFVHLASIKKKLRDMDPAETGKFTEETEQLDAYSEMLANLAALIWHQFNVSVLEAVKARNHSTFGVEEAQNEWNFVAS